MTSCKRLKKLSIHKKNPVKSWHSVHTTVIGSKTYRKFTEIKWELLKTRVCSVPFVVDRHVIGRLISGHGAFCLSLCSV